MAPQTVLVCLVATLCVSLSAAAPVSQLGVFVQPSVSVHNGHTTTLPCWLSPSQSAEGLEVRWYRESYFDSPAMLYRGKKFDSASQNASYVGRVSFGLKDAASAGLTAGDVSLMLKNTTLEDAGKYICYVTSDQGYDSGTVKLTVTEMGTIPVMSPVWKEDNMVNVSCESEGWYPKPSVRWSDQQQVLTPKSLKYSTDSSGLQSVHSWLLVSSSSVVSCSVGLSAEETQEARMRLENRPHPVSGSSSAPGWVAFALLLIGLVLGLLGFLYFKKRGKKGSDNAEENQKLLSKVIQPTDLSEAKTHYANVKPDETGNLYVKIKGLIMRDDPNCPGGQNASCLTAIKGTPGFSSGQHYWEVSLGRQATDPKKSWWLGVTSASGNPQNSDFTLSPSNGFWFLSSSHDRVDHFQFNTEPSVLLPLCSRPQTVGVYLDYNSGELSFYDVQNQSLIGSLTVTFKGEIFPLFNPGKNDISPMEILHMTAQGQSSDVENGDPSNNADKTITVPMEEGPVTAQGQSSDVENGDPSNNADKTITAATEEGPVTA